MIGPLVSMLITIQRNAPTNIIYKLKDDRKKMCIAVYPYEARTPRELTFARGAVISVLKKDKSGWWRGAISLGDEQRAIGWFPQQFVEDYVPGRSTEALIAGGMELHEAAVRSGAVDAESAHLAHKAGEITCCIERCSML